MDGDISTRVTVTRPPARPSNRDCLVVLYPTESKLYGHRIALDGPLSFGRGPDNDVVLDDDATSRRHCRVDIDELGCVVTDVGSKNGTYVSDVETKRRRLSPGDQLRIGTTIFKYLAGDDLELQFLETAHKLAIEDPLTGLPNRRALDQAMVREIARAKRLQNPLCVAILDADHFKRVNDGFGHIVGDFVLKKLARTLAEGLRAGDVLARYGGEEFALMLPDTTLEDARTLAERLRESIADAAFESTRGRIPITISIGVAALSGSMDSQGLLDEADARLYEAKRGGRNRVCTSPEG